MSVQYLILQESPLPEERVLLEDPPWLVKPTVLGAEEVWSVNILISTAAVVRDQMGSQLVG